MHVLVRPKPGAHPDVDAAAIEADIVEIVRSWHDELRDRLEQLHGEEAGIALATRYGKALPAGGIAGVSTGHVRCACAPAGSAAARCQHWQCMATGRLPR